MQRKKHTDPWIFYTESEGLTQNGNREGVWQSWYAGGKPKSYYTYTGGLAQGNCTDFKEDGKFETRFFENGEKK